MERTTIYLVVCRSGLYQNQRVIAAHLSKIDADFDVWRLEHSQPSFYYSYFIVESVELKGEDRSNKDFSKFLAERKEVLKGRIEKKKECSDGDLRAVTDLDRELDYLDQLTK